MANLQTTTVSGNLTVTGSSILKATSVSGAFAVAGDSYLSGNLTVTGSSVLQATSVSGAFTINGLSMSEEITTTASSATPTPTGGSARNFFSVTALAATATFGAPSGTPVNNNVLTIRIKDDGTARTLAFNAIYRGGTDLALPTTTVISKTMYLNFRYNSTDSKWDYMAQVGGI